MSAPEKSDESVRRAHRVASARLVMHWLRVGLPLSLLMDLVPERGPSSAAILVAEGHRRQGAWQGLPRQRLGRDGTLVR